MIKIKESELRLSFIRSRGPGGQNVNKSIFSVHGVKDVLDLFLSLSESKT